MQSCAAWAAKAAPQSLQRLLAPTREMQLRSRSVALAVRMVPLFSARCCCDALHFLQAERLVVQRQQARRQQRPRLLKFLQRLPSAWIQPALPAQKKQKAQQPQEPPRELPQQRSQAQSRQQRARAHPALALSHSLPRS
jgi:hypothetical protein